MEMKSLKTILLMICVSTNVISPYFNTAKFCNDFVRNA